MKKQVVEESFRVEVMRVKTPDGKGGMAAKFLAIRGGGIVAKAETVQALAVRMRNLGVRPA